MDTLAPRRHPPQPDVSPHRRSDAGWCWGAAHRETVLRLLRYSAVSLVSTSTSVVTLGVLVGLAGTPATLANVIATAVGTVPSFELNRRWVWNSTSRRSVLGQIVPFCALSFTGLVVSTVAVAVVAARTSGWGHWAHTAAVLAANVAAYGALWVVQYQLLDRVLFRDRTRVGGGAQLAAVAGRLPVSDGVAGPVHHVDHGRRGQYHGSSGLGEQRRVSVGGTEAVPEAEEADLD